MPRPLGSGQWKGLLNRDGPDEEVMRPPRALDHLDELSHILSAERVGLFSDFDGTLTPIFDDPRDTVLDSRIRDLLGVLTERLDLVAVVSGRGVGYLRGVVGLGGVTYVGNHGMEVWGAGRIEPDANAEVDSGLLGGVQRGVEGLGIRGLYVEDKGVNVAVHYRNAPDPAGARGAVLKMMRSFVETRDLAIKEGKMVVEVGPTAEVNKGTAVDRLARGAGLTGAIVLGDDVTDCDAFDAVHDAGLGRGFRGAAVAVVDEETPKAVLQKADYRLEGRGEVEEFLRWMAYSSPRSERKP